MNEHDNRRTDADERSVAVYVQAVDLDDPLMGFFVSWLHVAAQKFSKIHVFALRVGRHDLPHHVMVHALQNPHRPTSLRTLYTLIKSSLQTMREYPWIFVRGDAQYVLIMGVLWRLFGKKIVFWYAHYKVTWMTRLAGLISHAIVTSVPDACRLPGYDVRPIGQAIVPEPIISASCKRRIVSGQRWLMLGRVSEAKRVRDVVCDFMNAGLSDVSLDIIGPDSNTAYSADVEALIPAGAQIRWKKTHIRYMDIPRLLASYDALVNATPGSLDKVIIEACISGMPVITATPGARSLYDASSDWLIAQNPLERIETFHRLRRLDVEQRRAIGLQLREAALAQHSANQQILKLIMLFCSLE